MRIIKTIILVCGLSLILSGCTAMGKIVDSFDTPPEMKSPCVGVEESPCGPKRLPEHQWLINHHAIHVSA